MEHSPTSAIGTAWGRTPGATQPASNGYLLDVARTCGVVFERWVAPEPGRG